MDVYRQDINGKLQDVTTDNFVSIECWTLINGQMVCGTYYSMGCHMLDILHHEQNSINKRFISEENITSIKKGEELVSAVLVKEDEALPRVL